MNQLQSQGGGTDAVLTMLDPTVGFGFYSTYIGGSGTDQGFGVALTPNREIYLAGYTASSNFPATGGFAGSLHGGSDGFVVRIGEPLAGPVTGSPGSVTLNNIPSATGPSGVRPDGSFDVCLATDLAAGGFEGPVAQGRTFGNVAGGWSDGLFGSGWFDSVAPSVRQVGTSYAVVFGATDVGYFDLSGSVYVPRYASLDTLDVGTSEITFTDEAGNQVVFYSHDSSISPDKMGRFKKSVSAGGLETEVTAETGDGKIGEIQRDDGTTTESWLYAYVSSGVNAGLVSSITLRRKVGAGAWNTVRKAEYDYYDGTTAAGTVGALKTVTIKDSANNVVDRSYYRYYAAGETGGYAGALKFVFDNEAHARITAAYSSVDSATDVQAAPFAAFKLEYDSDRRVTTSVVGASGCSVCSGGQGTYTLAYALSGNTAGVNVWDTRMTETLPDGSTRKTYTNADGAPVLVAFTQNGASSPALDFWRYSSDGKLTLHANPSAVSGYSESNTDLVGYSGGSAAYLRDSDGLIETVAYGASTTATTSSAGDVDGMTKSTAIQQGETGTPVPQADFTYIVQTASSADYYFPADVTVYRNDNGTGGITTSAAYTWVTGTAQVESVTTTLPTVSTGQNGSGSANTTAVVADSNGRPVWFTDESGFLNYVEYDTVTGAVVKTITDVDDAQTGTFANLPGGWTTPTGGGLHLTTTYEADALGRTTKVVHPNGRVDYTVYNDAAHEVRFYAGWDSINDVPTGPTVVARTDLAGGYTEWLTTSATPTVSSGRPTGGEAVANVQSLSRSYRNAAGQTTETDAYFNLSGLTYSTSTALGTEGTHFYRTRYEYDDHGQVKRVQTPEGTVTRTVRDGLGRVASEWVGTDDTPTSGFWSPTNTAGTNLVKVAEYEYDGGGIGDNNLTTATRFPGGGAADRVTGYWHDWRNRVVAVKRGVEASESADVNRPLTVYEYDNLSHVTLTQLYDGDGVTPGISAGVLSLPGGTAAKLRAQSGNSFDELGRVYRADTYSVDPSSGSVGSDTLYTEMWFDARGSAIKVVSPGGLVQKVSYDGAGRLTATYLTDGGGDSGYSDADDVTGDTVLEQSEPTYDASGNVLKTVTRQRFHDASGTGALGSPSSGIGARVSYAGFYYDLADRPVAAVDVGTNAGSSWTRPGSVPSSSSTVHVTLTAYATDAVQTVTLTGGPTGGTFTLTFGGQTTSAIAYNASAATVDSALEALSSIGTGNVAVIAAPGGSGWEVRFTGTLADSYQSAITGSGANLTGGTSPAVAVATVNAGGDAGRVAEVTDAAGRVHRTYADPLGRTVRAVEHFTDGVVTSAANKTVGYSYNSAGVTALTAYLSGGTFQTTGYVFGVTQSGGSGLDSNDLAGATRWADPSTGLPSGAEEEVTTVNALGATLTYTDRNGTTHELSYDVVGRLAADEVTAFGTGVDQSVARIEYAYDTLGNLALVTSRDALGGIVNQVQREFNGLGQLVTEYQEHGGAVNTSTSLKVQQSWSEMPSGANHSRLTSITYPDGYVLTLNYSSGLNSDISRLSSLSDAGGTLEEFDHLGYGTVVARKDQQPGVDLTYIKRSGESDADAGDQYTGLDRFGRVADQRWAVASSGTARERLQHSYDILGNPLTRDNLVNSSFDEDYDYDDLNQLVDFARGAHTQAWDYDALGNWDSLTTDGGSPEARTHNAQNQITGISSATTPAFDDNGNMTGDEVGNTLVYDAWNRLVEVKSGSTVLMTYRYDGLNRRVSADDGTDVTDLYYSDQWQVLEERVNGSVYARYVWSPVYVDALVLRDRDSDGNGSLDQRLYAVQDANFNVVALLDTSGNVVERYAYDPFGAVTVMNANWSGIGSSAYVWVYLHQGGRFDSVSGLYHFRNRDYSPTLGRWVSVDPIRFQAGDVNLYRALGNNPTNATDPSGLQEKKNGNPPILIADSSLLHLLEKLSYSIQAIPNTVAEFNPLAFDFLASGSANKTLQWISPRVWTTKTFHTIMALHCGQGWNVTQVELRITGIKFAPATRVDQGGVVSFGPERRFATAYVQTSDGLQKQMSKEQFPAAHFRLDGYWLFRGYPE